MAYTKRQFLELAYEEIGLAGYVFNLPPEQYAKALRRLDAMMAEWAVNGVQVGYPLAGSPQDSSEDTEFDVPLFAVEPIYASLAMRLAQTVGKTPSPDTKRIAREGYETLCEQCIEVPEMQQARRMPLGAGNKYWGWRFREYFRPRPAAPPNVDNITTDDI